MGRLERLEQRRVDDTLLTKAAQANEVYRRIKESESVRYTIGAMQPIDPEYTKNTFAQGDRVKSQLQQRLTTECDFEYQGSTTTDTHIKAKSDIDLLEIRKGFTFLDPGVPPSSPYGGDAAADMRALRRSTVAALSAAFPQASVDNSCSMAIKLSGASLTRAVDIVPAVWWDTNAYRQSGERIYRGVDVFNQDTGRFVGNTPFLHKRQIELRDQTTRGGLRKAARLLKSLMYDSEGRVSMSSYNIVGIAFNIPEGELTVQAPRELTILEACCMFCDRLTVDVALRNSIRVPDGHRPVFGGDAGATSAQLQALNKEVQDLRRDVINDNIRSFKKLAEARVDYGEPVLMR